MLWTSVYCICQSVFWEKRNFLGSGGNLIKESFGGRHEQHSSSIHRGLTMTPLQWICISFIPSSRCT